MFHDIKICSSVSLSCRAVVSVLHNIGCQFVYFNCMQNIEQCYNDSLLFFIYYSIFAFLVCVNYVSLEAALSSFTAWDILSFYMQTFHGKNNKINLINNRGIFWNVMHVKYCKRYFRYIFNILYVKSKKKSRKYAFYFRSVVPFALDIFKFRILLY